MDERKFWPRVTFEVLSMLGAAVLCGHSLFLKLGFEVRRLRS
jgi:hypothetical protein